MKFAVALVGAAAASSEQGIAMLKTLNSMNQDIENMQQVKTALVQCAVNGDCSAEAAAMPNLALASNTTDTSDNNASPTSAWAHWENCVKQSGAEACAKEKEAALNSKDVTFWKNQVKKECTTDAIAKPPADEDQTAYKA